MCYLCGKSSNLFNDENLFLFIFPFDAIYHISASEPHDTNNSKKDTNDSESIGIDVYKKLTQGTNPQERIESFNDYLDVIDALGQLVDSKDVDPDVPNYKYDEGDLLRQTQ